MSNKEIIKQLKALKQLEVGGRPQVFWLESNKEILLSQISPRATSRTESTFKVAETSLPAYYFHYLNDLFCQKVVRPVGIALLVVLVYFGYTATATIANASLPGELLYPIKTAGENMQLALTFDDSKKVQLQMNFISRRGDELQQIVKQDGTAEDKKDQITSTVNKITTDVQQVSKDLNKISLASASVATVNLAKEVDDKTLKVEKDIVDARSLLSSELKKETVDDVTAAIASAEATGVAALNVIVDQSANSQTNVSQSDLVSRVTERIKTSESSLALAVNEINKVTSTIPLMVSTSVDKMGKITTSTAVLSTTTLKDMIDGTKQVQTAIDQAKVLLDKNEIGSALVKIQESKILVSEVIGKTSAALDPKIVVSLQNSVEIKNSSSTTVTTQNSNSSSPIIINK